MPNDFGTMTNLQRKNGNILVTRDINNNWVVLPSPPIPQCSQNGVVTFANMAATSDLPLGSTWSFDIIALGLPSGEGMTINIQTHLANGNAGFTQQVPLVVTIDPSIPGPPDHFDVTPGTNVTA